MNARLRLIFAVASIVCGFALSSCGGGDSSTAPDPTDPVAQTVSIQVSTSGVDLDPDGYTVQLGTRTVSVASDGTASFTGVLPGSYEVSLQGVALNCLADGGAASRSLTVGSSAAQLALVVECWVDFDDGLPTVACTTLDLSTGSALPTESVTASGLPAALGEVLVARVMSADRDDLGWTYFEPRSGGSAAMLAPLHPSGSASGGEVWVRVADESAACPPVAFTVEPLPDHSGEMLEAVDALQQSVADQAAILGTTPADLRATPIDEVAEPYLPIALVQYVLDHPQNPNSLRAVATGTAAPEVDPALLDALIAESGLADDLAALNVSGGALRQAAPLAIAAQTCLPGTIGTSETLLLSDCMNAQAEAQANVESELGQAIRSISEWSWMLEGLEGAAGRRAAWVNAILWVLEMSDTRLAALLPCCIVDLAVDADRDFFEEDFPGEAMWTATLTARSLGYDLGGEIVDAILKAVSVASSVDASQVSNFDIDTRLGAFLTGPVESILTEDLGLFSIPPETFGPVPVFEEPWTEVSIAGSAIEQVDHNRYRPVEVGSASFRVATRPDAPESMFGRQEAAHHTEVEVREIEITVTPDQGFVAPGDSIVLQVRVENAFFPDSLDWIADQGFADLQLGSDNLHRLVYFAPADARFENPADLTVYHAGSTGALASGRVPDDEARLTFGKIEIDPRPVCLDTDTEQQFGVEIEGPDTEEVNWFADDGSIDSDGLFAAPSTRPASGYTWVKARHAEYPALADSVQVPIGCSCQFTMDVDGQQLVGEPGDQLYFTDWGGPNEPYGNNDELFAVTVSRASEGWSTTVFPLEDDPATWPGGVGVTNGVRIQGDMGLGEGDILYASDDDLPAWIDVEEYTAEESVKGRAFAHTVSILSSSPPYSRESSLNMSFAITVPPGTQRGAPLAPWGYRFACTIPGGGP